jgi:disulfide bond formation protein DsbB
VSYPPLLIPFTFALAALSMALISQYGFGTFPCHLCLLQRYPYGGVILLCAIGMVLRRRAIIRPILLLSCLAFLTTAGMGAYHTAVEHGWVAASDGCAASTESVASLEALRAQIMDAPLVSCADVGASFAGVSMPLWNLLYGIAAAIVTLRLWRKRHA